MPKTAIVTLGMHRSGTSLGMSVLDALGVPVGSRLIEAARSNPAGFYEHTEVVAIQEKLLSQLGRVWHGPTGTHPFPDGWLARADVQQARKDLGALIKAEFAANGDIWGFKDPRTARFLPLWDQVFADQGITARYILMMRHPDTVAQSLLRHNGVDPSRGQLIWLQHNLDAVEGAGDALACVLNFDRLVSDPTVEVDRMIAALDGTINVSAEARMAAIGKISSKLRTHKDKGAQIENPVIAQAFKGLSAMARDDHGPDVIALAQQTRAMACLYEPWRTDKSGLIFDWALRLILRRKYR